MSELKWTVQNNQIKSTIERTSLQGIPALRMFTTLTSGTNVLNILKIIRYKKIVRLHINLSFLCYIKCSNFNGIDECYKHS